MASKKKVTTAVVAAATAATLLLGGTFAWQSINQTALNEASDVVNPGGRLHDDFNGENKDVYVENFAENDIFARIRLEEYFAVTMNKGTNGEIYKEIAGKMDQDTEKITEWATHYFDVENATDEYWDWQTGGSTVFMPTFNKNKDSLVADINGTYNGKDNYVTDAADDDRYTDYVKYNFGQTESGDAIYDYDSNDADEVGNDFENLSNYSDNVTTVSEEHTAKNTLGAELISMAEWQALSEDEQIGEYWVYDTDGWVYWAAPIAPGEATGLLLDGISLDEKMDDSWYYAINVIAQFVTADDVGKSDGTGFYDTTSGTAPSSDAEALLKKIGVDMPDEVAGDDEMQTLVLTEDEDNSVTIEHGDSVKIEAEDGADISAILVDGGEWSEDSDWTYDPDTQILTLNGPDSYYDISDANGSYKGTVYFEEDSDVMTDVITIQKTDLQYPYYANEEGYVYMTGLDQEAGSSFTVTVDSSLELAENGLAAEFGETINGTSFTVDEHDPYTATLTLASMDNQSVTITATTTDGETYTVTAVPIFEIIIITPDMNGESIYLTSGYYTLEPKDFSNNTSVSFTLSGANRSLIIEDEGKQKLSLSSYESAESYTITATDGTNTVTVTVIPVETFPFDGAIFSYFISGAGEPWAHSLMPGQDYLWLIEDDYTYEVSLGLTTSFDGTVAWKLEGMDANDAGFVSADGSLVSELVAAKDQRQVNIKLTEKLSAGETLTLTATVTPAPDDTQHDGNGNYTFTIRPYDSNTVIPKRVVIETTKDINESDTYEFGANENATFTFTAYDSEGNDLNMTNADFTWSVLDNDDNVVSGYTVTEGTEDGNSVTITHTCTEENCTCPEETCELYITLDLMGERYSNSVWIRSVVSTSEE